MPKRFWIGSNIQAWGYAHFLHAKPVPLAILEDLNDACEDGIRKRVWKPTEFNAYGTLVVLAWKAICPEQNKARMRVCGDYSVTVNSQLETHCQPIPLPEDLMRNLWGGYCFTKVDLADAYTQIKLPPESRKRLALSTDWGVLFRGITTIGAGRAVVTHLSLDG